MVKKSIGVVMAVSGIAAFLGAFGASMRFYGAVEPTLIDIRYVATGFRNDVKEVQEGLALTIAKVDLLERQERLNIQHRKQIEVEINRLKCLNSEDKKCSF